MKASRSLLFCPGDRPTVVAKAQASPADGVIFDLEDAVALSEKDAARSVLVEMAEPSRPTYVRVNDSHTEWLLDDLRAAVRSGIAGVVVPKAETHDELVRIDGAISALEAAKGLDRGSVEIIPLIESALGVLHAHELCTASPRVSSIIFGSAEQGDLVADLGCEWSPEDTSLLAARSHVLLASRAAGIEHPLDGAFMNLQDPDALRVATDLARQVGYVGKTVIHPSQIDIVNDVFTPSGEEVAEQHQILEAFEGATAEGSAVFAHEGRMIDYAVVRRARSIVARGEQARGEAP